jgi:hypothetical protein
MPKVFKTYDCWPNKCLKSNMSDRKAAPIANAAGDVAVKVVGLSSIHWLPLIFQHAAGWGVTPPENPPVWLLLSGAM